VFGQSVLIQSEIMEAEIKMRFDKAWKAIVVGKSRNKMNLSHREYQYQLKKVRQLKASKKSLNNYILLHKYNIAIKDGRERLVKPSQQEGVTPDQYLMYVTNEEMYDVLHEAYIDTNHGGRKRMYKRIHGRYCNVTMEAVSTYLNQRQLVELRAISPVDEQGLLLVPPPHVNCSKSVYFGFVDMHRYARDGYTCIMVHWDTDTRLTHMVPLQSMDHVHVAVSLLEIYSEFGIPNFIDAPHDRSYITSIVEHIKSVSGGEDCRITIRSSDDKDAIKTGWNTVQKVMEPFMTITNFQRNWPSKLKYIQYLTNKRNDSGKDY